MTVHVLKCDPEYFLAVETGEKQFEIRPDDREPPFERGDVVAMINTGAGPGYGATMIRRVGYIARGNRIPEGFCMFALAPKEPGDDIRVEMALGRTAVSK